MAVRVFQRSFLHELKEQLVVVVIAGIFSVIVCVTVGLGISKLAHVPSNDRVIWTAAGILTLLITLYSVLRAYRKEVRKVEIRDRYMLVEFFNGRTENVLYPSIKKMVYNDEVPMYCRLVTPHEDIIINGLLSRHEMLELTVAHSIQLISVIDELMEDYQQPKTETEYPLLYKIVAVIMTPALAAAIVHFISDFLERWAEGTPEALAFGMVRVAIVLPLSAMLVGAVYSLYFVFDKIGVDERGIVAKRWGKQVRLNYNEISSVNEIVILGLVTLSGKGRKIPLGKSMPGYEVISERLEENVQVLRDRYNLSFPVVCHRPKWKIWLLPVIFLVLPMGVLLGLFLLRGSSYDPTVLLILAGVFLYGLYLIVSQEIRYEFERDSFSLVTLLKKNTYQVAQIKDARLVVTNDENGWGKIVITMSDNRKIEMTEVDLNFSVQVLFVFLQREWRGA